MVAESEVNWAEEEVVVTRDSVKEIQRKKKMSRDTQRC